MSSSKTREDGIQAGLYPNKATKTIIWNTHSCKSAGSKSTNTRQSHEEKHKDLKFNHPSTCPKMWASLDFILMQNTSFSTKDSLARKDASNLGWH